MAKKKLKVAICYDFDGTLAPGNMQEHNFIPDLGMTKEEFWSHVKSYQKEHQCDQILAYMFLMIDIARHNGVEVTRSDFVNYGSKLPLFDGVSNWFKLMKDRANTYYDIELEHYIMSAGLKPMIEGTSIVTELKKVFASDFLYSGQKPYWAAYSVNFTSKTQFLFRIEKGIFNEESIDDLNNAQLKNKIYIPFNHMIYIGDGLTDVPCMKLTKERGGYSIAVFNPEKPESIKAAKKLFKESRVHFIAPTDYKKDSHLWRYIDYILNKISLEGLLETKQRSCIRTKEVRNVKA